MELSTLARTRSVEVQSLREPWRTVAVGFLTEKVHRTGSCRTAEVYGRTLSRFLRGIGDPAAVSPLDVHAFAYCPTTEGRPPAPSTVCVRIAAISGLYDFACRMGLLGKNPAEGVRRPRCRPVPPRGLTFGEVKRLLAVIPETPAGLVDRALVITAVLTGLRRCELFDLQTSDGVHYRVRTKGGVVRMLSLPDPAHRAIAMAAAAGPNRAARFPIAAATFYSHLRRYGERADLGRITPHVLRHTAAKLRRQAGASIEDVSSFLGHRSLATTAVYLRRLDDEPNNGWQAVAAHLGLESRPVDRDNIDGVAASVPTQARQHRVGESVQGGCYRSRPASWMEALACTPTTKRSYRHRRNYGRLGESRQAPHLCGSSAQVPFLPLSVRTAMVA